MKFVIRESANSQWQVVLTGLSKGDFQINVKDDLLTISSQKTESDLVETPNWHRQEYRPGGFERSFVLFLYAPGLSKGDFQINVKDDLLTISSQKTESDLVETPGWRRHEYRPGGFERSFVLNEKVDVANIGAAYEDGVLKVTLPKLPGMETKRQDVFVA